MNAPQEFLKQYVQSRYFASTVDIMAAMKNMFRDIIQQKYDFLFATWVLRQQA